MAFYLRRSAARFLTHTYTWTDVDATPVLDTGQPTYDSEGNQIYTNAAPVVGVVCLFLWEDIEVVNAQGRILLRTPSLYVLHNDPVAEADLITNVLGRDGTNLYAAGTVQTVDPTTEVGDSVLKVLRLSGAVTI